MDRSTSATPEGATEHNQPGHSALFLRPVVEIDHSLAESRINSPKMQALVAAAFAKYRGPGLASEAAPKRGPKQAPKQAPARQAPLQYVPLGQIRPRPGQARRTLDPAAQTDEAHNEESQEAPPVDAYDSGASAAEAAAGAAADEATSQGGGTKRADGAASDLGESLDALVRDAPPSAAPSDEAPVEPDETSPLLGAESAAEPAPEVLLHQEAVPANLRTTQRSLPGLPAPVDPAHRQELATMLTATRETIAVTLARWGMQA